MKYNLLNINHSVSSLYIHLVFVTKYRKSLITKEIRDFIGIKFYEVYKENKCELIEFNYEKNHVHLLVFFNPSIRIADLVMNLKGRSSYELGTCGLFRKRKSAFWTHSYFVATAGGAPLEVIKTYIKNQENPI